MLTIRKVESTDRDLLNAAAVADKFHFDAGLTGEHWQAGKALLYSDGEGPVFAIQPIKVMRLDIQFIASDRKRKLHALVEGFWPFIGVLRDRGIEEIIFNSNSAAVISFFEKRFNFRHIGGNTYSLRIL